LFVKSHPFDGNSLTLLLHSPEWQHQSFSIIGESIMGKHDAKAAVATAPDTTPDETKVETPATETPAPEAPAETPAETPAAQDNKTLGEIIANAPEGAVTSTTAKMPKEVASLIGTRRSVALKLGAVLGLMRDLKVDLLQLIAEEAKTLRPAERDSYYSFVKSGDSIEKMSKECIQILTGSFKQED
jgi:hypothetical protein